MVRGKVQMFDVLQGQSLPKAVSPKQSSSTFRDITSSATRSLRWGSYESFTFQQRYSTNGPSLSLTDNLISNLAILGNIMYRLSFKWDHQKVLTMYNQHASTSRLRDYSKAHGYAQFKFLFLQRIYSNKKMLNSLTIYILSIVLVHE